MIKLGLLLCREPDDLSWYRPLGLGCLVSYLRDQGLDFSALITDDVERLIDWRPDVAGLSCSSAAYGRAVERAGRVRSRLGAPLLLGGVHISTCPESLSPLFDAAVLGEGERTLLELLRLFEREGMLRPDDLRAIDGLAWLERGRLERSAPRALIDPLDQLPPPDRAALGYTGGPAHIMTSRGCPYSCAFCSSAAHWGRYRAFSAMRVADELQQLHEQFNAQQVHIYDDLFTADRTRLELIATELERRGLLGKLKLSGAVRANLTDPALAELLRRMGFERITFGAESASARVLKYLKGNVTPEQNQRSVDAAHAAGIKVGLSFIVGVPGETREDVLSTFRFISSNVLAHKIDQADVNLLVPLPATEVWRLAEQRGLVGTQMDWERLRRPWDGLVLEPSFAEHGVEYFRWDSQVRRMLELLRRPRIGVMPFSVSGREQALSAKNPGLNVLYLVADEARQPSVLTGSGLDIVICSRDDWFRFSRELPRSSPESLVFFGESGRDLIDQAELLKRLAWAAHLGGYDLLHCASLTALSVDALARYIDPSPSMLSDPARRPDLSGLKTDDFEQLGNWDPFAPANLAQSPDSAAGLSDLLSAYSEGFLERQRALNVESELRGRIAALTSESKGKERA